MEYIILKSSDPDVLSNMVAHAIKNSWCPQGASIQYIQAMVRGE